MVLNPEPPDAILFLEFGPTDKPLEVVLKEARPGQPAEVKKMLEELLVHDGLFVYRASDGQIVTAAEYLRTFKESVKVYYPDLTDPRDTVLRHEGTVPDEEKRGDLLAIKSGSREELIEYLNGLESHDRLYVWRADIDMIVTPSQYLGKTPMEPA